MVDIDKLMKLHSEATPGPWKLDAHFGRVLNVTDLGNERVVADCLRVYKRALRCKKNAAYICEACNSVPGLVARIRDLERLCEQQQHRLDLKSKIIAELERRHA